MNHTRPIYTYTSTHTCSSTMYMYTCMTLYMYALDLQSQAYRLSLTLTLILSLSLSLSLSPPSLSPPSLSLSPSLPLPFSNRHCIHRHTCNVHNDIVHDCTHINMDIRRCTSSSELCPKPQQPLSSCPGHQLTRRSPTAGQIKNNLGRPRDTLLTGYSVHLTHIHTHNGHACGQHAHTPYTNYKHLRSKHASYVPDS